MRLLIIGCGYLGERVARGWPGKVMALTRSADRAAEFEAAGWTPVRGDVCDPGLALPPADAVLWAVGMDRSAGRSMADVYVGGLANTLPRLPAGAPLVYVSSVGIYGQTDGAEVDESAPTEPTEESGRVVRDAEAELRRQRPDAIVLRFAGIYGPGRLLRRVEQVRAGDPVAGDPDAWLNLIHVHDGARVARAALERGPAGVTWNVSDDHPPRRRDYYGELARLVGGPEPVFSGVPGPRPANRRIVSRRVWPGLALTPDFPDYRFGLAASLGLPAPEIAE
jgi:nucleoside-diphosphate-sugar epimerase